MNTRRRPVFKTSAALAGVAVVYATVLLPDYLIEPTDVVSTVQVTLARSSK
jgi:hypothetical protein